MMKRLSTKIIKHLFCKERLRELGMFRMEKVQQFCPQKRKF